MALVDLLRNVEMFAGLSDEQLELLADRFEERTLERGDVLFKQGEQGDTMCLIQEGFLEVVFEPQDGVEKPLVRLGPGQSVGEMTLIDRGPRSATVWVISDRTQIASITREAFDTLCEANTDLGYQVMRNIAADLSFRMRFRDIRGT
jgi:CRP/FNR family cyclic AMP-dependent transcriptional regulator